MTPHLHLAGFHSALYTGVDRRKPIRDIIPVIRRWIRGDIFDFRRVGVFKGDKTSVTEATPGGR